MELMLLLVLAFFLFLFFLCVWGLWRRIHGLDFQSREFASRIRFLENEIKKLQNALQDAEDFRKSTHSALLSAPGGPIASGVAPEALQPSTPKVAVPSDHQQAAVPALSPTGFEEKLGTSWLNRLGVVILVIGIALFIGYKLHTLGSAARLTRLSSQASREYFQSISTATASPVNSAPGS